MALYHFHVTQIKRSEGRTAVASAAYRAGEKLHNLWDGETHDYTKKGGVILAEIILPEHAPRKFFDRSTLWNEVEQVEKHYKAQLAYSFDMALQNEFSLEENIELARAGSASLPGIHIQTDEKTVDELRDEVLAQIQ